ncbi:hypothetical protein NPX13_g3187 [Xylaria arbuscula]|uniref:Uncharacterized protein n=1 Tax=Xylaria arbuscula TaxID=114810 RepID=A0A9W8NI81_9PEZI|nr:hypothetical protein NPX13_g3187 [Xylaria arbuscula]
MTSKRISSWTKFKLPSTKSLEPSLFKPLAVGKNDYLHDAYYGSIAEANDEHILVVIWVSHEGFAAFKDSTQYLELLINLGVDVSSVELSTQVVDFDRIPFWWRFTPNTEIRTVYFPAPLPSETREEMKKNKGLVLTTSYGIDGSMAHLSPYNGVPECGWAENVRKWKDRDTVACLWIHYWKSREDEDRFKTTERRPPLDGDDDMPLAVEAFDRDLEKCGALGWEDVHIDFKRVPKSG